MIGTIGRLGVMPHILYQRGNNAPITGTIVPFCYRGGMMKEMSVEELIKFKINDLDDRTKLAIALVNAGYTIKIIKEEKLVGWDFFVVVYDI